MVNMIEMPDGARLTLSAKGWQSDSRPALANVLNLFYPAESNLDAQADRIARRFRWQLLTKASAAPKSFTGGVTPENARDARK